MRRRNPPRQFDRRRVNLGLGRNLVWRIDQRKVNLALRRNLCASGCKRSYNFQEKHLIDDHFTLGWLIGKILKLAIRMSKITESHIHPFVHKSLRPHILVGVSRRARSLRK
jgi:hypothetical protein